MTQTVGELNVSVELSEDDFWDLLETELLRPSFPRRLSNAAREISATIVVGFGLTAFIGLLVYLLTGC